VNRAAPTEETRLRILRATARCVVRWSVSKTTLTDVAEEAGVSRATLYRVFPGGRAELLQAVVQHEVDAFFGELAAVTAHSPELASLLVDGLLHARRALDGHGLYQRVMDTEPHLILPMVTVESWRIRQAVAERLREPVEKAGLEPGPELDELCEFLARMVLSCIETPGIWAMDQRDVVEDLVESRFVAPVLEAVRRAGRDD
jgi:AcrR family transcriptional regulator